MLARNLLPWIGEQLKQGRELVVEARLLDDDITDKQATEMVDRLLEHINDGMARSAAVASVVEEFDLGWDWTPDA